MRITVIREDCRFTESKIIAILNEAEAGMKGKDLCRQHGIADAAGKRKRSP